MYSYVSSNTNVINITYIIDHNVAERQTCVRKPNPNFDPHLLVQVSIERDFRPVLRHPSLLNWILLFVDTSQRVFGTNLGADVLASVQLYSVSIINEFSARVSTRSGSVLSFLLRSFPSFSLGRGIIVSHSYFLSSFRSVRPRALRHALLEYSWRPRKVDIRVNVGRNSARKVQPRFVVHARESRMYN